MNKGFLTTKTNTYTYSSKYISWFNTISSVEQLVVNVKLCLQLCFFYFCLLGPYYVGVTLQVDPRYVKGSPIEVDWYKY